MIFDIVTIVIALLQLNNYSDSLLAKIMPLAVYLIYLLYYSVKNPTFSIWLLVRRYPEIFVLLFVIFFGLVRSSGPEFSTAFLWNRGISYILLFLGLCVSLDYAKKVGFSILDMIANFVVKPFLGFALINFLLWALNIKVKESIVLGDIVDKQAVLLSYLGINVDRVEFTLAAGFNNYAVIIGGLFTVSLFLTYSRQYKRLAQFSVLVSVITLLLIDSRASLFFPILVFFLVKLFRNKEVFSRLIPYFALLLLVGPIILVIVMPLLAELPALQSLSRNSEELATGNSRFFIWGICLGEFLQFKINHLYGYGDFGHFGSGLSSIWASFFVTWENAEAKTPHSTLFGVLLDYGYLGLVTYIYVFYTVFKRVQANWHLLLLGNYTVFAFFVFTLLVGITETLAGFYIPNFLILFTLVLIISLSLDYRSASRKLD